MKTPSPALVPITSFVHLGTGSPDYQSILHAHDGFQLGDKWLCTRNIVRCEQVHGNHIHLCNPDDSGEGFGSKPPIPLADGIITSIPGQYLLIRTADCAPILFTDIQHRAVAAVHSGREGTRKNIVGKAVQLLTQHFAIQPQELHCYIGACVCARHYEVSTAIYDEFVADMRAMGITPAYKGERLLDLRNCIFQQLLACGIPFRNIDQDHSCTFESEGYFSYRQDGTSNRQINIVGLEYE